MSVGYSAVQWNRHKRVYDGVIATGVITYLSLFVVMSRMLHRSPNLISDEIIALRALGSCAFLLLSIILCIGPLARLDRRFLPLLYNRRHLGVTTFFVSAVHAALAIGYYHGFGSLNPFVSLLISNTNFASFRAFPFQILGLGALIILFLLASTSHDFWNKNLSAATWKRLHMLVYVAYGLLVGHVALGALQTDRTSAEVIIVAAGVLLVGTLHLLTGGREVRRDRGAAKNVGTPSEQWVDAGPASTIPADRARTLCLRGGERIAVFRHGDSISAVANVCAHQGGPLGEGKIIDGCITCPWHGWQYRAHDGCSPPPFQEKIATYQVRIVRGNVHVNPKPLPPGTAVEPARLTEADHA